MASGREKAIIWPERVNSGGSWPPAFPQLTLDCLFYTFIIGQDLVALGFGLK